MIRSDLLQPIEDSPGGTEFTEELDFQITQDPQRTNQEVVSDAIEDGAEFLSGVPEWFESMSQKTNDALIEWASTLDKAAETAGEKATDNIRETKVTGYFTRLGRWIQRPVNLAIVGGVLLGLWFFKK